MSRYFIDKEYDSKLIIEYEDSADNDQKQLSWYSNIGFVRERTVLDPRNLKEVNLDDEHMGKLVKLIIKYINDNDLIKD